MRSCCSFAFFLLWHIPNSINKLNFWSWAFFLVNIWIRCCCLNTFIFHIHVVSFMHIFSNSCIVFLSCRLRWIDLYSTDYEALINLNFSPKFVQDDDISGVNIKIWLLTARFIFLISEGLLLLLLFILMLVLLLSHIVEIYRLRNIFYCGFLSLSLAFSFRINTVSVDSLIKLIYILIAALFRLFRKFEILVLDVKDLRVSAIALLKSLIWSDLLWWVVLHWLNIYDWISLLIIIAANLIIKNLRFV